MYSEQVVKAILNKTSFNSVDIGIMEKFIFKVHNKNSFKSSIAQEFKK